MSRSYDEIWVDCQIVHRLCDKAWDRLLADESNPALRKAYDEALARSRDLRADLRKAFAREMRAGACCGLKSNKGAK